MADALFPGSGRVVCLILLASEAAGACWLYLSFRLRPAKLVIRHNPDDDERLAFAEELEKRLARNQIVREAGLVPSDEEFAEKAMLLLDKKADDEIRSAGKRIFLGTALAQNGKLDALIVFFSLVRLVWRVSSIYNQRPAPREIMSVYGARVLRHLRGFFPGRAGHSEDHHGLGESDRAFGSSRHDSSFRAVHGLGPACVYGRGH